MTSPEIKAADYNFIHNNVSKILGPGIGSFGYGQTVQSTPVAVGNIATKDQWNNLRSDIINCKIHQTGIFPPIVNLNTIPVIDDTPADPLVNFTLLADESSRFRFSVAPSQSQITLRSTKVLNTAWSVALVLELSASFANADQARYFFNSGGKLGITPFRTGGGSTDQNRSWSATFESAGVQYFSADPFKAVNFYTLTNVYQTYYQKRADAAYYENNLIRYQAKCNTADNSLGGATQIDLRIIFLDGYEDRDPGGPTPDQVDGNLRIEISEVKASGTLFPSEPSDGGPTGNFSIVSPTFSVGEITSTSTPPSSLPPPQDPLAIDPTSLSVLISPTGNTSGNTIFKTSASNAQLLTEFTITRISGTGAVIFEVIDYDLDLIVKLNFVETTAVSFSLDEVTTSVTVQLQIDPRNASEGNKTIQIRTRTTIDTDLATINFNVLP